MARSTEWRTLASVMSGVRPIIGAARSCSVSPARVPECRPHLERGSHLTLYRFTPEDYNEIAEIAQKLRNDAGF
jgi:hypothetical protein